MGQAIVTFGPRKVSFYSLYHFDHQKSKTEEDLKELELRSVHQFSIH